MAIKEYEPIQEYNPIPEYSPITEYPVEDSSPAGDVFKNNQNKVLKAVGDFTGSQGLAKGITQGIQGKTKTIKNTINQIGSTDDLYSKLLKKAATMPRGFERDNLVRQANQLQSGATTYNDVVGLLGTPVTNKEILGSTLQQGVNVISAGIPAAKTLKGAVATGALTSGASAFGQGIESNKTVGQSLKGSILPTALGGAIGGATFKLSQAVNKTLEKSPQKLYEDALNIKDKLEKPVVEKGKEVSSDLLKRKWVGSLKTIYNKTNTANDIVENQVSDLVNNYDKPVGSLDVMEKLYSGLKEKFGDEYSDEAIVKVLNGDKFTIEKLRKAAINNSDISLVDVNNAKKSVGKLLSDNDWLKSQDDMTLSKKIAQESRTILANYVKELEPKTKPLFDEWSKLIKINDVVVDAYNQNSSKKGLSMADWLISASTLVPSIMAGKTLEAIPAVAVGVGAKKIYENPAFKTNAAQKLVSLKKILDNTPASVKEIPVKLDRLFLTNLLKKLNK